MKSKLWEWALLSFVFCAFCVGYFWATNYRYEHVTDGAGVTCYFDSWAPDIKCFEHEVVVDMTYERDA